MKLLFNITLFVITTIKCTYKYVKTETRVNSVVVYYVCDESTGMLIHSFSLTMYLVIQNLVLEFI